MSRCAICHKVLDGDGWIWQPWGPDPEPLSGSAFTRPAFFYRGFPAVHICVSCMEAQRGGAHLDWDYKGRRYILNAKGVPIEVPAWVEDALLWVETLP